MMENFWSFLLACRPTGSPEWGHNFLLRYFYFAGMIYAVIPWCGEAVACRAGTHSTWANFYKCADPFRLHGTTLAKDRNFIQGIMVLTNIFGTMAKWSKRPIGGCRNDLDTYKEKLCDLVDHHFERKQFTRHVSTRVPRREKKWILKKCRRPIISSKQSQMVLWVYRTCLIWYVV